MRKKKNIVLENLHVTDYAAEGKSLARHEGKVIFIEGAVPGDVVSVRLGRNKADWAEGHAIAFHAWSPDRVEPFCKHFGVCGGCQWQQLPYEKQLQYKERQVHDALTRIGKLDLPGIRPILGCEQTKHYRNKLEYTFSSRRYLLRSELGDPSVSADEPAAGFHARGIFDKVVDVDICHLQAEPTNRIRKAARAWAIDRGLPFYDINRHEGFLRTMQVRLCRSGEIMVNVMLGTDDEPAARALMAHLRSRFPEITTLLYTINLKGNDSLAGLTPVVYDGPGYVIETLDGFSFKIGPASFFQTNTAQAERLYRVTRDLARLTGRETVYDLYCGTGSIGIFVSAGLAKLIGVELVEDAVRDARENAALNGLANAQFFAGDATEVCGDSFFAEHGRPDVVITDPPRAGMTPQLVAKLLEIGASRIVYVSCNPATQARDLQGLDAAYRVTAVQPVDMFPHTLHIENVVALERRDA